MKHKCVSLGIQGPTPLSGFNPFPAHPPTLPLYEACIPGNLFTKQTGRVLPHSFTSAQTISSTGNALIALPGQSRDNSAFEILLKSQLLHNVFHTTQENITSESCKNKLDSNPYILRLLYPMSSMRTGAMSCHYISHKTRLDTKLTILSDFFPQWRPLSLSLVLFFSLLDIFVGRGWGAAFFL